MKSGGSNAAMAGIPVPVIATGALIDSLHADPAVLLVRAPGGRRLDPQRRGLHDRAAVLGLSDGRGRFANHHDGNLAAILVLSFTVVSGLVAPWPEQPKPARGTGCGQEEVEASSSPEETPRLVNALAG